MNYDYYTQRIYEWLINNAIADKIQTLIDLLSKVSVFVEHIAFYGLVLVLLLIRKNLKPTYSRTNTRP